MLKRYLLLLLVLPIAGAAAPGPAGPGGGVPRHDHSSSAQGGNLGAVTFEGSVTMGVAPAGADLSVLGELLIYGSGGVQNGALSALGSGMVLDSIDDGETISIRGEDAGGTLRNLVVCDPDGACSLNYNGSSRVTTTSAGANVTGTVLANTVNSTGNANVGGDLTVTGDVVAAGDLTVQRLMWGRFSSTGVIQSGSGESDFGTVAHTAASGIYAIDYVDDFSVSPACTVSAESPLIAGVVSSATSDDVTITLVDDSGSATDAAFNLICAARY